MSTKLRAILAAVVALIVAGVVLNIIGARKPMDPVRLQKLMTESLTAQEQQYAQALVKGDLEALAFHTADAFAGASPEDGSPKTKASLLAILRSGELKVEATATVTAAYSEKALIKGAERTFTGRLTDNWVELDGRWQRVKSAATR